jgi:hypothetical protein
LAADPASWSNHPTHHAAGQQRLFHVRVTKHTGLVLACYNQRYTVTGTFAQCEAAIEAQQHNVLAGWWSFASLVVWNWVALVENLSALRRHPAQTYAAHPPGSWARPTAPI